jgi:hypothetical protein
VLGIAVREYNMCKGIKCFIVVVGSQTINVFVGARRWRHVSISALFFVFLGVDHLATEQTFNFSIVAIIVNLKVIFFGNNAHKISYIWLLT